MKYKRIAALLQLGLRPLCVNYKNTCIHNIYHSQLRSNDQASVLLTTSKAHLSSESYVHKMQLEGKEIVTIIACGLPAVNHFPITELSFLVLHWLSVWRWLFYLKQGFAASGLQQKARWAMQMWHLYSNLISLRLAVIGSNNNADVQLPNSKLTYVPVCTTVFQEDIWGFFRASLDQP